MKAAPTRVNPSFHSLGTCLARPLLGRHVAQMASKDKEREERLAAALRENLKRRKAQTREIGAGDDKKND